MYRENNSTTVAGYLCGDHCAEPPNAVLATLDTTSELQCPVEPRGRYTELAECGRGGMGRVLLVHDNFLGREVALKEFQPTPGRFEEQTTAGAIGLTSDFLGRSAAYVTSESLFQFLQEARITVLLEHPGIVPIYDVGRRECGKLYYTMKPIHGRSLSRALRSCNNLNCRLQLLPHFMDLCRVIAYAHSHRIIHRDIKPANVMIDDRGKTFVLDWGLAKQLTAKRILEDHSRAVLGSKSLGVTNIKETECGQLLGTPCYMSPEQAMCDQTEIDEQSDVYALGVVLCEILTGRVPFGGNSTRELLNNVIRGRLTRIRGWENTVPKGLTAIATKAMAKEKAGRYSDVLNLIKDLEKLQSVSLARSKCGATRTFLAHRQ